MPPPPVIIDLTSDSEDEVDEDEAPLAPTHEIPRGEQRDAVAGGYADVFFADFLAGRERVNPALPIMGEHAGVPLEIDDFGYLDEEPDEEAVADQEEEDRELARALNGEQVFSQDDCLARIYEMFPDLCPEHALILYNQLGEDFDDLPAAIRLDRIIEKILTNGSYPKRKKDSQQLKRKRENSIVEDFGRWEREDREVPPRHLIGSIRSILKAEFPNFTHGSINEVMAEEKYLFKPYVRLAELRDTDGKRHRGRPPTAQSNADTIADSSGWPPLKEELIAARKKSEIDRTSRLEKASKKRSEDDNLRRSVAIGQTAECSACFDDLPTNRQAHCHGETPHFTCFSCIQTYIETQIGDSQCNVMCTAGCGAGFAPAQLNLVDDKRLLQKLADLQQEKDIRDAGLDNLEECPFCDYKAIMPPIEEDFEFRCANPDCEKVSCRRCKATSHIPFTCAQYAKDQKSNSRHTIEEARTAALIRSCNKCKKQFIKEFGCNKMSCPSCRNLQCYVCSENLKGYDHFDQHPGGEPRPGGKCPLYDNLEERHEREIKAAEEIARAQVLANNPDVAPEDLEIKMSDAVNKSSAQKIRRAGPEGLGGGPAGWGGAGLFAGGLAHPFFDDEDEDDAADQRRQLNRLAAGLAAHRPPIGIPARPRAGPIGNVLPAALHARLRRQRHHARRDAEADLNELRDIDNAIRAGPVNQGMPVADPFRLERARQPLPVHPNAIPPNAPYLRPDYVYDGEGLRLIGHQPFPPPGMFPARAAPLAPERDAGPPGVVPPPMNGPERFDGFPAFPHYGNYGIPAAMQNLPAPMPPFQQPPNDQLNAAGWANVRRNLAQLELLRQRNDEMNANAAMLRNADAGPPHPRGVERRIFRH